MRPITQSALTAEEFGRPRLEFPFGGVHPERKSNKFCKPFANRGCFSEKNKMKTPKNETIGTKNPKVSAIRNLPKPFLIIDVSRARTSYKGKWFRKVSEPEKPIP